MTKQHMGRIEQWGKATYGDQTMIWGVFVARPGWPPNSYGHTSYIVAEDGNEIETRNSRYTLGAPRMKNVADVTDNWGSWVRIDLRPGTTLDDPEMIMVTIKDYALAAVTLNKGQVQELIDGLEDALWLAQKAI
jgi:hypothetical protein